MSESLDLLNGFIRKLFQTNDFILRDASDMEKRVRQLREADGRLGGNLEKISRTTMQSSDSCRDFVESSSGISRGLQSTVKISEETARSLEEMKI